MNTALNCFALFTHLILLLQSSESESLLDPVDFHALQSIRMSLSDLPGSSFFSSWNFTADPCTTFAGVDCNGSSRVVRLNLGDSRAGTPGLSGRLHADIGNLSSLTELTVTPGRITGLLPQNISHLKFLTFLGINRNFISGEVPASFGDLRELRTLDLSYNLLNGTLPPSVGSLPALSKVILCHNRFTGPVPRFASQNLTRLDLKNNHLSGCLPVDGFPPSVEYLSLSSNNLTGPVGPVLAGLSGLRHVDLSMNRFNGSVPVTLFGFPIGDLLLHRNNFSGWVLPEVQVTIPTVDLSHNRIYGNVSSMFSTVENLYLNNNRFTGEVPGSLVKQLLAGNITTLYLQHNFLNKIEINPRAKIPDKSSLCLWYNCMVLPVDTPCPLSAGTSKSRPTEQCPNWN